MQFRIKTKTYKKKIRWINEIKYVRNTDRCLIGYRMKNDTNAVMIEILIHRTMRRKSENLKWKERSTCKTNEKRHIDAEECIESANAINARTSKLFFESSVDPVLHHPHSERSMQTSSILHNGFTSESREYAEFFFRCSEVVPSSF